MTLFLKKCDLVWTNKNGWSRTRSYCTKSITNKNRQKRWYRHGLLKPTKINSSRHDQSNIVWFEANCKPAWTLVYFFWAPRPCLFRQCVAFHPNDCVDVRLCQHWSTISCNAGYYSFKIMSEEMIVVEKMNRLEILKWVGILASLHTVQAKFLCK